MKTDQLYLAHVRDAIERIFEYTGEGKKSFLSRRIIQDAVVRNLEIVGEAVKQLSWDLKDAHGDTPWKQIAGMRDKLIHEYFGVNLDLVWNTVENDLPKLKEKIESLLRSE